MKAWHRRRIHLTLLGVWMGPGLAACWFWAHSLAWLVFMSWFANIYSITAAYSSETPVEKEQT